MLERKAVREGVGLIDVSTLGKLEIFGADAPALLDGAPALLDASVLSYRAAVDEVYREATATATVDQVYCDAAVLASVRARGSNLARRRDGTV